MLHELILIFMNYMVVHIMYVLSFTMTFLYFLKLMEWNPSVVKFIFSEKATNFCEISIVDLS